MGILQKPGKRQVILLLMLATMIVSVVGLIQSYPIVAASKCAPDFTISASPASQTVQQGFGTRFTVTVTGVCGFQSIVDWGISSITPSLTATITQPSYHFAVCCDHSYYNYVTVDTNSNTVRSTYTITFLGRAISGFNHQSHISNPVTLTVT